MGLVKKEDGLKGWLSLQRMMHKWGNLSEFPCPTFKKPGVMECVCNLWGLLAQQPSLTSKL